jgi:hypothetical protein
MEFWLGGTKGRPPPHEQRNEGWFQMPRLKGGLVAWMPVVACLIAALGWPGCARMPYPTKVIHSDSRVTVKLLREVTPTGYTQPVTIEPQDLARVLRGFSIREEQRLPLPWFSEEVPPRVLFREDELTALVPHLSEALGTAKADERVRFQVLAPGMNPADSRDVTAGWMAVREQYLYLSIEQFHTEIPIKKVDSYFQNYPQIPPLPKNYLLLFEPGRFWRNDQEGTPALAYRQFLRSVPALPETRIP